MALSTDVGQDKGKKQEYLQFEECDIENCKYRNESKSKNGKFYCAYETCIKDRELPETAKMILKTCKVCGEKFATTMTEMEIQICDDCQQGLVAAAGSPHSCLFCGSDMSSKDDNPSLLVPICSDCMSRLNRSMHCKECGNA